MTEKKFSDSVKGVVYPILFFSAIIGSCNYFINKGDKNKMNVSEIRPNQVTLDTKFDPYPIETDLVFRGIATQSGQNFTVFFVDHSYNGSLDCVVLLSPKLNSAERDTIYTDSPCFSEWNKKFLEMRKRRFEYK